MIHFDQQRRGFLRWTAWIAIATLSPRAWAQTSVPTAPPAGAQSIYQPNGCLLFAPVNFPASRTSGLVLSVDSRWVNGYGYRPIRVTISSAKTATADRTISIRLHAGWDSDTTVEGDFELPAGSTRSSTTLAVPIYDQSMYRFWWDVWVDGAKDDDLSIGKGSQTAYKAGISLTPSSIKIMVPGGESNHKSSFQSGAYDFDVLPLKLSEFPNRWIDYTCLDIVSLSTAELQLLAQTNSQASDAMLRWVRAGGQLWVNDVGDELERLAEVSKLLHLPEAVSPTASQDKEKSEVDASAAKNGESAAEDDKASVEVGWRPARFGGENSSRVSQGFLDSQTGQNVWVSDARVIATLSRDPNFTRLPQPPADLPDPRSERMFPQDSSKWFLEQPVALGRVRAFRGPNEAALMAESSSAALANLNPNLSISRGGLALGLQSTRHWDLRHGIVPDSGSPEFAKLLVPGVGVAPVGAFQVLITLFVLLIGPVNYWLLKRFKRLQLLVLTVPLSAGVATGGLFIYAILSDGFSTQVRARSYTMLDQHTGEAACWTRLSYYAGIAPGNGLTMPADVVVYPLLPGWTHPSNFAHDRTIIWDNNAAKLTSGWLNSRTPTQYLSVRSRKTPARIDVSSGRGTIQVTNRLNTRINSLLVLDDTGAFFSGDDLAADATAVLAPISRDDAVKQIVQLVRDNEPKAPDALSGGERDYFSRRPQQPRRQFGRYRRLFGDDPSNGNVAGIAIWDLAGLNGRPALDLPARSFVATTEIGPEVETGLANAKESASFHVIVGRW
jgi:hypothetical protein